MEPTAKKSIIEGLELTGSLLPQLKLWTDGIELLLDPERLLVDSRIHKQTAPILISPMEIYSTEMISDPFHIILIPELENNKLNISIIREDAIIFDLEIVRIEQGLKHTLRTNDKVNLAETEKNTILLMSVLSVARVIYGINN